MPFLRKYAGNLALVFAAAVTFAVLLIYLPLETFGFVKAAPYFGAIVGAGVGFCALMAGHLFNSHLNRKRDRELRVSHLGDCAAAILTEMVLNILTVRAIASYLKSGQFVTNRSIVAMCKLISTKVFDDHNLDYYACVEYVEGKINFQNILPQLNTARIMRHGVADTAPDGDGELSAQMIAGFLQAAESTERQLENAYRDFAVIVSLLRGRDINFLGDFSNPVRNDQ